jgi:hypothetical protein
MWVTTLMTATTMIQSQSYPSCGKMDLTYMERLDDLLARISVSKKTAVSFFLGRLTAPLGKSVRIHNPPIVHDAMHLPHLWQDILQDLEKKIMVGNSSSSESQPHDSKGWSSST